MYDYECGSSTLVDSVTIGGWNTVATDGTAAVVVVCVKQWGRNTVVIDGAAAAVVVSVCKTMGAEHCCY